MDSGVWSEASCSNPVDDDEVSGAPSTLLEVTTDRGLV
ncbi:hypothetical protein GFS60_02127 [Rhodococcus sp. WAY2]|jgi:hypothetical protein|nr:hypothetical protein GFS60_02127 [Rhodococcus sp. WAY2]